MINLQIGGIISYEPKQLPANFRLEKWLDSKETTYSFY